VTTAFHPERTEDEHTLRWVVPAGWVRAVGPLRTAPAPLRALLEDGTLAALALAPDAVLTTRAEGRAWRDIAAAVRAALAVALEQPEAWEVACPEGGLLAACLTRVLDGGAGDYIRGHGGEVTVQRVAGDEAWLGMGGACRHCPALVLTIQGTIERELRRLHPAPFRLHVNEPVPAGR
jgi:Fe-S cluster biogenesis protein NfuA